MSFFWNEALHQPSWYVLLALGIILGYVVPKIPTAIFYAWRRMTEHSAIEGDWHAYHFTYISGKPSTVRSHLHVAKGFRWPYVAYYYQNVDSQLEYTGRIKRERGHLIFTCRSKEHDETVYQRFPDPLGKDCSRLYGLWLSFDHTQTVAAGAIMLSKNEIPMEKIDAIIAKGYELSLPRPLARIKKQ